MALALVTSLNSITVKLRAGNACAVGETQGREVSDK
jgi:hypothetical protein